MHTNETKDKFIELRAQGLSLGRIASKLGVSKRTLVDWNCERQQDIRALRAVELEALHERILLSQKEELTRLATWQKTVETELGARPFKAANTEKLLVAALSIRREIDRVRLQANLERILLRERSNPPPGPIAQAQGQSASQKAPPNP